MRTSRHALALGATLATLVTASLAGLPADCTDLPNGSFHQGFEGWTIEPASEGVGSYRAAAHADIIDMTGFGLDTDAARLNVFVGANHAPGGSDVRARTALRTTATVAGAFLRLQTHGFFEVTFLGGAENAYSAEITVTGAAGNIAHFPILLSSRFKASYPCGYGAVGTGVFPWDSMSIDLASAGFALGDVVEIEVALYARVSTEDACDVGIYEGGLIVDDFAFCDRAASS